MFQYLLTIYNVDALTGIFQSDTIEVEDRSLCDVFKENAQRVWLKRAQQLTQTLRDNEEVFRKDNQGEMNKLFWSILIIFVKFWSIAELVLYLC